MRGDFVSDSADGLFGDQWDREIAYTREKAASKVVRDLALVPWSHGPQKKRPRNHSRFGLSVLLVFYLFALKKLSVTPLLLTVGAVVVLAEDRVGDITVGDNLYGAVVVAQLLLGDDIRVVAVDMAVDADDIVHDARYCAHVVRYHHNSYLVAEVVQ